jgi:DNA-binding GntR family transcriptional regulator
MNPSDSDRPAALTDWAYKIIKDDLLRHDTPPGRQLHVEALAEQLGISRTPVREALLKLERDGLVHVVPRVGFFVSELSYEDIMELFELRELIETWAAERAARFLTAADLERMEQLIQESVWAVEQGDLSRFLEIDVEFHNLLIERSDNRRLVSMLEGVRDLMFRERIFSLRSQENIQASLGEHRRILEALSRRDGERAGKAMSEHLSNAGERLGRLFETATAAGK